MAEQFLDTNILLRHFLQDVPDQSARATELIRRVEAGDVQVHISDIVIFEVVFTLTRSYRHPKAAVRDAVLALLDLPGFILPGKRRFHRVFDLYVDLNISFADAYHVVLMEQQKLEEVVSFDRDFDRVKTVKRVEP
jgi:predicted nucleic acid-binding protein